MNNIIDGYNSRFIDKIKFFSNKKLCEIIVSSRYLGAMQKEAILCMEELASRRANGDQFEYEDFITQEFKKLPDFKINLKQKMTIGGFDLSSALKGIKK